MTNIPTNAEVVSWLIIAVLLIAGLIFINFVTDSSNLHIEDIEAWNRNYAKIQRRR